MTIVVFFLKETLYWSYVSRAMFVCWLVFRLMENQMKIFITTKYHQMTAIKGISVHSFRLYY